MMGEHAEESQSDTTAQTEAKAPEAPTLASALMGAGSIIYSGSWDRVSGVSTMLADVGRNAATSN
jgi:hypothetical protein